MPLKCYSFPHFQLWYIPVTYQSFEPGLALCNNGTTIISGIKCDNLPGIWGLLVRRVPVALHWLDS
jgi:hypothetical protein